MAIRKAAKVFVTVSVMAIISLMSTARAATYYVSTNGNNGDLGTSPGTAWRNISYAAGRAGAGDTVYVKGGLYGNENVSCPSGTAANPIVFEGYDGTPVIDQGFRSGSFLNGFYVNAASYVTIRNFEIIGYLNCIYIINSSYITVENVNCHDCGYLTYQGYGIAVVNSNHCTLRDCIVTNCGGSDYQIQASDYCTLDGCQAIGTLVSTDQYATDYYIILAWSSNNTIIDCVAEDVAKSQKGNHGIGIKDGGTSSHEHSTGNQFIRCRGYALEECIYAAHGAHHNTFTDCIGDSSQKSYYFNNGIMVRDGAHDNLFLNCKAIAGPGALCIYANENINKTLIEKTQYNNTFRNCTFIARGSYWSGQFCMWVRNAQNNLFDGCSFVNSPSLIYFSKDNDGVERNFGNVFLNCTIYNVGQLANLGQQYMPPYSWTFGYDDMADVSFQYCNFWQNGFEMPGGTGNTSQQAYFVDPEHDDYRVQLPLVWIDFAFAGLESGTQAEPFKTLGGGIPWVIPGGTIRIKAGSRNEPIRLIKQMRIESSGGTATIGRQ